MRIVVDFQACQNASRQRGIGRYTMALTRALLALESGHDFWIALSDRFPGTIGPIRRALKGLIPQDRIVVFHLPAGLSGADPAGAWRSRAGEALREHFLASLHPDLVFIPSLFEGYWDECVTSIGRQPIPTVTTIYDLIPLAWPRDYINAPQDRACYDRKLLSLRRADWWLAISEHTRAEACQLLDLPQDRVLNISAAVEASFRPISYSPAATHDLLVRFGITRPFVMFTSAIEHRKNVDGLIHAYSRLPAKLRLAHQLVLVGAVESYARDHLNAMARDVGLEDGEMVLTGYASDEDLIGLYNLCQVFVFPSLYEGFGLPALEAMTCGAPVIGSSATSVPEVIGRKDALFDPRDGKAMTALIERVLTDEGFRTELREYGLARVDEFSWEASARRALAAFESVHAARASVPPGDRQDGVRPRLAYVSALAPIDTPSALRAAALTQELARRYEIVLVSDQADVQAPALTANFPLHSTDWFGEHAGDFERVVYDLDGASSEVIALMLRHPGVVVLDALFIADTRADLDDRAFLAWLYDLHGYGAALLAAERGRDAAAAAYPLVQGALEDAGGVISLSDGVDRDAGLWFSDLARRDWRSIPANDNARLAADALADAIEGFTRNSPASRRRRLIEQISAECPIIPSQADVISVARAMTANQRPAGRTRLLVDVSAVARLPPVNRRRRLMAGQIAGLIGDDALGRRIEPVYADQAGYRYARAFTLEALGLDIAGLRDEAAQIFPGDVYLALEPPPMSCAPALAVLQAQGVRVLFAALDEPGSLVGPVQAPFAAVLKTWIDQALAADAGPGVWLLPSAFNRLNKASAARRRAAPRPGRLDRTLGRLKAYWDQGVDACAMLIGRSEPVVQAIRAQSQQSLKSQNRLLALQVPAKQEKALLAAIDGFEAQRAAAASDFNFTVTGHVLGSYSLAIINRAVARSLNRAHPGRVKLVAYENGPVASFDLAPVAEQRELQDIAARSLPEGGRNVVISQHYPLLKPDGAWDLSLALFAWEESLVPAQTVKALAAGFDGVLAMSQYTAKALIDSGLNIPVTSIGLPPDLSDFADLRRTPKAPGEPFVFLHVSSAFPRKGVDVLLAAWARAFRRGDPVRLVLKAFPNPHNDVADQLAELRQRDPDCAEIELIDRDVDQADLLDLYRWADAVVSPSRGEGYNLAALEAMAAGIPVIVTGYGGHRDFCGPDEARLVDYRLARSASHVAAYHALWAEPDEDDLVAALREMLDPDWRVSVDARVARARSVALTTADPAQWARRLEDVVDGLLRRAPTLTTRIAWVSTWDVQCGIAEYSRFLLEHFSTAARGEMVVVCDQRTPAGQASGLHASPAWTIGAPTTWTPIAEDIARSGADAVVIQHQDGLLRWPALVELLADTRLANRVTVVVLHNAIQLRQSSQEERTLVGCGLRKATRVLVHALADVNLLLELGVGDNVTLLPHGAGRPDEAPAVRDLADRTSSPIIGCHGFFLPGKGIERLIRACAELRKTWPNLRLRLVNARFPAEVSDHEIEDCRAVAEALGLSDAIDWHTDFLSPGDISGLLAGCDLIAMPYDERTDSASGAVRVALSSLVPVAVTRVGIFAELGEAVGWLDSSEPVGMAKDIEDLLRDARRRRTIQAGAAAWLDAHDWTSLAQRLETMIEGLVEAKRLRDGLTDAGG